MRLRLVVALALVLGLTPPLAQAAEKTPSPAPAANAADPENANVLDGRVTSVDYQKGIVAVDAGRGPVEVTVTPSTSVQSTDPGYYTLNDVVRGAHVQIYTSKSEGKLIAQIIRLIKH